MKPFPHHYSARLTDGAFAYAELTAGGVPPLRTAPPPEFEGPGDAWSPEQLLLAAVESWVGFRLLEGTYFVEVPSLVQAWDLVVIALISWTLCLISAWIPARRAAALNPVTGLHG